MNKLVTYLAENFHPGGNAFKIVMVERDLVDSPFTLEEIFEMTLEAREEKMIAMSVNSKGNRWGIDQMEPENLESIAITREGLKWWKKQLVCK